MKKALLAGCFALYASSAHAQYIDGLAPAASVSASDLVPVVQGSQSLTGGSLIPGSGTERRATVGQLTTAVGGLFVPYTGASSAVNLGAFPLTLGVATAPSAPGTGGAFYIDSSNVLHYLSSNGTGGLLMAQTGVGGLLPPILSLTKTEAVIPTGGSDVMVNLIDNVNFADGGPIGYNGVSITKNVNGSGGVGPQGNVYPFTSNLNESALRSTLSAPTLSQDTNITSNVSKTIPGGGIPAGRKMRDSWNWWSQYFTANIPTSQGGADVIWEHDFNGNGLDDWNARPLEQTPISLRVPLSSGGYPMSINNGRSIGTGNPDVWAHDWESAGGGFSHAALDLFFANSAFATITSTTPGAPVHSVTVDNIMPLESGGSSGGPDFPVVSLAGFTKAATASSTGTTVTLADTNYLAVGMMGLDVTSNGIPEGIRIASIAGNVVTLASSETITSGDTLVFSWGFKKVTINGHNYNVGAVVLAGAGTHAGTAYFTSAVTVLDATNGVQITPNAHSIWLCDGSATAPWCDIAFNKQGSATLRADGSSGLVITGTGLTLPGLTMTGIAKSLVASAVSAAGTTQGTATTIAANVNVVTTAASGTGVVLPSAVGAEFEVLNRGANALLVYPPAGASIDGGTLNAGVSVVVSGKVRLVCATTTACYSE